MKLDDYEIPLPGLKKLFRAEVILDKTYPLGDVGTGYSEIVTITGGRFEGELNGSILDFGGDWGLLHSETVNVMDTRYLFKTEDGALISINCRGRLIMSRAFMASMENDQSLHGEDCYFRQTIEFSTGAEKYKWLNGIVSIGMTIITPEGNVCMDVYQLE